MRILYFLGLVLFSNTLVFSQWHDNTWILGYDAEGMIIDFSESPPIISEYFPQLNLDNTNVGMSNYQGDFLFYSNGIFVHDEEDIFMQGSDTLNAGVWAESFIEYGYPLFDGMIALPDFDNNQIINLIHRRIEPHNQFGIAIPDILVSQIDMTLNGGKGAITFKNKIITKSLKFEGAAATKHANGRDWWIVTPHEDKNHFFRFLLSSEGVKDTLTQIIGYKPPFPDSIDGNGQNRFSPDGSIYVDFDAWNGIRIFDFDRCTGLLSNFQLIEFPDKLSFGAGAAISPNSRFLYTDSQEYIFQYDLYAADLKASVDTVAVFDGFGLPTMPNTFGLMQLGPDGKIYISSSSSDLHLHVINHPNKQGVACDVKQHSLELPNFNCFEWPYYPNYRLGPLDGSSCDTLNLDNRPLAHYTHEIDSLNTLQVVFVDNSFYEPTDWFWDFGDNGVSNEQNPIYSYSEEGTYEVCLTVSNDFDSDTFCKMVMITTTSTKNLASDISFELYPNPTSDRVFVSVQSPTSQSLSLQITNLLGEVMTTVSLSSGMSHQEISLESFASGTYFYQLLGEVQVFDSGKLLLIK